MEPWPEERTARQACAESVARVLALDPALRSQIPLAREITALLASGVPDVALGVPPGPSGAALGHDGTPVEISVRSAPSGHAVRWLVEGAPVAAPLAEALASWEHATWIAGQLHERYGATVEQLREVEAAYRPSAGAPARYCFAAALTSRGPRFQVYFARAWPTEAQLRAALRTYACESFADRLLPLVTTRAPISFATDLVPLADARAKIYVSPLTYDPQELESYRKLAGSLWPENLDEVLRTWFGDIPKPLLNPRGGLILCFHLRRGELTAVTVHAGLGCTEYEFPDDRLLTDGELVENLSRSMERLGIDPGFYRSAVEELATGDLAEELGIHAFASLLVEGGQPSVTAYLSPRFYLHRFGFR